MPDPDKQVLTPPLRPNRWDIRMIISIPALVVLLVIMVGLANYWVINDVANELDHLLPEYDTTFIIERILAIFLISTFLAVIIGSAIIYSFLRPIRKMSEALVQIRQGQAKHQPLKVNAAFELECLGMSFNSLISHLNETIEEREAYLNEGLLAGSMLVDPNGLIRSINSTGVEILGGTEKDYVGHVLKNLQKMSVPSASSFVDFCRQAIEQPQSIPQSKVNLPPINAGEKYVSVAYSVLKDESNKVSGFLFQFIDISRINNLNAIFSRTDQLAALGTFVFGLSHELRNPLGAIKGTAQLLSEKVGKDDSCVPFLDRIVREVDRLDRLVRELYDFSRTPGGTEHAEDLNAIAAQVLGEVMAGLPSERKDGRMVDEIYEASLPMVYIQKDRVKRAIANVMINAFEHMPQGAQMKIQTRREQNAGVFLEITNTGSQINEKNIGRVFEPFFSTRQGGTGLGLAIAYQIVAQNHGSLTANNQPDAVSFCFQFRNLIEQPGEATHA